MGRRSIISSTDIKRLFSAYNSYKKTQEKNDLINANSNIIKEKPCQYEIISFEFNEHSRSAKIVFLESKEYRTIERYVTQNYVRYPIYGSWKTKSKNINKTIKLTNEELENLNVNPDFLISKFAIEIIQRLNNDDLIPSWLIKKFLKDEEISIVEKLESAYETSKKLIEQQNTNFKSDIADKQKAVKLLDINIQKNDLKFNKVSKRLSKLSSKKKSILLSLVTFGIRSLLISKKNINRISAKKDYYRHCLDDLNASKNTLLKEIYRDEEKIKSNNDKIIKDCKVKEENITKTHNDFDAKIKLVEPLLIEVKDDCKDFIPLKKFIGMKYTKIVGCYVIRNVELNKYYAGQSKDVIKRVTKDHFNGTKPRNIIFAEDYFNSKLENKDNLFEVKVIRCLSKDELDKVEMQLIEQYDSFLNGYNGTGGNK